MNVTPVRPSTPMKMPSTTISVRPLRRVTSANDFFRLALERLLMRYRISRRSIAGPSSFTIGAIRRNVASSESSSSAGSSDTV